MARTLPPDDDPAFAEWVRQIPLQELDLEADPVPVGHPVVAVLTLAALLTGLGGSLIIATLLVLNALSMPVALISISTGMGLAVGSLAYLLWRAE
jgi:hypothetical protein